MKIFLILFILFKYSSLLISQNKVALINANVIDGINPLKKNMTILIDEGKIQSIAKNLKPSKRGEYEITDLINIYINQDNCSNIKLLDWWIDAGTPDRILELEKKLS